MRLVMRRFYFLLFELAVLPLVVSCGGATTGTVSPVISVRDSTSATSVAAGQQAQFTATVTGTTNTSVTWIVVGGAADGTISASGLYTAPAVVPNPALATVTAPSQADPPQPGYGSIT